MVIANGDAYVGASPGSAAAITAYDATTGAQLWRTKFSNHDQVADSSPAYANGKVYIVSLNNSLRHHLVALDAQHGHELWSILLPNPTNIIYTEPVVANGMVLLSRHAYDGTTGKLRWAIADHDAHQCGQLQQNFPSTSVTNGVAYLRCGDGSIEARNVSTGALLSIRPSSKDGTLPVVVGGVMYYGSSGRMVARDVSTGTLRWAAPTLAPVGPPTVTTSTIYAPVDDRTAIEAFDAATGRSKWRVRVNYAEGNVVAVNGVVYVPVGYPEQRLDLEALDGATGRVLRTVTVGGDFTDIAVVNGKVYLSVNGPAPAGVLHVLAP